MIRNTGKNKVLWFLVSELAFVAALIGVFDPNIYITLVSPVLRPASSR